MIQLHQQKGKSTFVWEIEGELTEEQTHRMRESMDTIISQGVLAIHDGKAILDFNFEGKLCGVRFEFTKWKRKSA